MYAPSPQVPHLNSLKESNLTPTKASLTLVQVPGPPSEPDPNSNKESEATTPMPPVQ